MFQIWLTLAQLFWTSLKYFLNFFLNFIWCYPPLVKGNQVLHLNKLESPSPKDALSLWHVFLRYAQWYRGRRFITFVHEFPLFRYYLPWEEAGPSYEELNITPYPQNALCHVGTCWNWNSDWANEDVQILWMYFCYLVIISPWKMTVASLNPRHPRILCATFGRNWLSQLWRRRF